MFAVRVFAVATLVAATAPPPTLAASALTTIYSFKGGQDGSGPLTGVAASDGLFYGTTEGGHGDHCPDAIIPSGCGSVFGLNLVTGVEQALHGFKPIEGGQGPLDVVVQAGIIYGLTRGSEADYGSVFSFDPQTRRMMVLHRFTMARTAHTPMPEWWRLAGLCSARHMRVVEPRATTAMAAVWYSAWM